MYLQGVLDAVREVLESAKWNGITRSGCVLPVGLRQVRHDHESMTLAPKSSSLQHRLLVLNTASIQIHPWEAKGHIKK